MLSTRYKKSQLVFAKARVFRSSRIDLCSRVNINLISGEKRDFDRLSHIGMLLSPLAPFAILPSAHLTSQSRKGKRERKR